MDLPTEKQISLAIQTNKSLEDYKQIGKVAESFKFDCLTVYNDLLYQPPWIPLSLIAQATKSIKIGVASVNPYTSHPINIASNIALINEISKGRAYLGISRGAWLNYLGIFPKNSIVALYDAMRSINHLLRKLNSQFKSDYFPLQGGDSLRWPIPYPEIPFLLGSWGPKTIIKSKDLISEIKLGASANPDIVPFYKSILNNTNIKVTLGCVTVVDEDGDKARELAKREVALYLPVIMRYDKTITIEEEILTKMTLLANKFDYKGITEYIDDELLNKFTFSGTPEDIIHQTLAIFKKKGDRVEYGTPHGTTSEKGIDLLGTQVLPAVREKLGVSDG